jgi:hypothetical protein
LHTDAVELRMLEIPQLNGPEFLQHYSLRSAAGLW